MKYFRDYTDKTSYNSDINNWTYLTPNLCRVNNYENNQKRILFHKRTGLYDILYVNNSNPSQKIVSFDILPVSDGYTPIAMRVISENFFGNNEPSRWMSLKYMYFDNMNTTETGTQPYITNAQNGSLTNVDMTWDESSTYSPKTSTYTQEQLNTSRYKADWTNITYTWPDLSFSNGTIAEDKFQNTTRVSLTYDWAYLPSSAFSNKYSSSTGNIGSSSPSNTSMFYDDTLRGWHNDANSNSRWLPSLYTEKRNWVVNKFPSEFVYPTHALTRIHGKEATQKIVSEYSNAAPLSGSTTYVGKCLYETRLQELKPFYCCSQYRTIGINAGDWYLPAIGELAFIIPDLTFIRQRLNAISQVYPNDCISTLASTGYWSSFEGGWYSAWYVNTGSGSVYGSYKNYRLACLAFLQYST